MKKQCITCFVQTENVELPLLRFDRVLSSICFYDAIIDSMQCSCTLVFKISPLLTIAPEERQFVELCVFKEREDLLYKHYFHLTALIISDRIALYILSSISSKISIIVFSLSTFILTILNETKIGQTLKFYFTAAQLLHWKFLSARLEMVCVKSA